MFGAIKPASGAALALSIAFSCGASPAQAQQAGDRVPDIWNCLFVEGPITPTYEANAAASEAGGRLLHVFQNFPGFTIRAPQHAIEVMVARNPMIETCDMAQVVALPELSGAAGIVLKGPPGGGGGGGGGKPDKGDGGGGGGGGRSKETVPWGIAYVGEGVANGGTAWVVDTGVSSSTGDLNLDTGASASFLSPAYAALDGTSTDDLNGHGTHVAGTIAAQKNNYAVVGVAPGARVVAIKVLNYAGIGLDSDVAAGLDYVLSVAQPGDAVNLSISGDRGSNLMDAAVTSYVEAFTTGGGGPYLIIAAGNTGEDVNHPDRPSPPADIDGDGVFSVGAIDSSESWASFSNYGSSVDYAEPGVNIVSLNTSGRTATKSGTSMAAPHLTGILLTTGGLDYPATPPTATDPVGSEIEIGKTAPTP